MLLNTLSSDCVHVKIVVFLDVFGRYIQTFWGDLLHPYSEKKNVNPLHQGSRLSFHWSLSTELQGVTPRKTIILIHISVRTSILTLAVFVRLEWHLAS